MILDCYYFIVVFNSIATIVILLYLCMIETSINVHGFTLILSS